LIKAKINHPFLDHLGDNNSTLKASFLPVISCFWIQNTFHARRGVISTLAEIPTHVSQGGQLHAAVTATGNSGLTDTQRFIGRLDTGVLGTEQYAAFRQLLEGMLEQEFKHKVSALEHGQECLLNWRLVFDAVYFINQIGPGGDHLTKAGAYEKQLRLCRHLPTPHR
jgi:hypothetical protein